MRLLDEIEQLLLAEVGAADDQLVRPVLARARAARSATPPSTGRPRRLAVGESDADELVVDAAAAEPERAPQRDEPLAVADEHRAPAHAGDAPACRAVTTS